MRFVSRLRLNDPLHCSTPVWICKMKLLYVTWASLAVTWLCFFVQTRTGLSTVGRRGIGAGPTSRLFSSTALLATLVPFCPVAPASVNCKSNRIQKIRCPRSTLCTQVCSPGCRDYVVQAFTSGPFNELLGSWVIRGEMNHCIVLYCIVLSATCESTRSKLGFPNQTLHPVSGLRNYK